MPTVDKSCTSLSRRSFLKTTSLVAGASIASAGAGMTISAIADEHAAKSPGNSEIEVFTGVCRPNCFGACQLNVHVKDGKVVKTSPAEYSIPEFRRICLRGLSHPYRIYDPERIKYPMRRVGERGSDQWERISWEEAIEEIAEKLASIRSSYGDQSIASWHISGNYGFLSGGGGIYTPLWTELNATNIAPCVDLANTVGINRVVGWAGLWVSNEAADMKNAKTAFIWGNNITEAQLQEWHFVADAIEAGTKIIVIDPTFTQLAAKADEWIPIRPASDAALILSMIHLIIERDLIDRDFIAEKTVGPYLVRSDNGKFLKMSDLGVAPTEGPIDPTTGEPSMVDPVAVIDSELKSAVSVDSSKNPAISGSLVVDGVECRTAYDLLVEASSEYTPEYASKLTEVPVETIHHLVDLATDGPVTHRVGWGSQAYANGVHPHHAGAAMVALIGGIGKPGAGYGAADIKYNSYGYAPALTAGTDKSRTSPGISVLHLPDVMKTGTFKGEECVIKAAWIAAGNPLSTAVDSNAMIEEVFNKLEFIVTVDSAFTDTARYSDIVLPVAQFFEYEEIVERGQSNYLQYNEKCIDPPYEAKSDSEIMRLVAEKMGFDIYPYTDSELFEHFIDESPYYQSLGITFERLKKEKNIRLFQDFPVIAWEGAEFLTPSGRMEFYVENAVPFLDQGQEYDAERERLPRFFEPAEAWPTNELYEKYPFVLMSERPRFRVHSQWFSTRWLRELDPEPTVKINPDDAGSLGIMDGDHVECFNDRGHCVAKAVFSEAIRPGTLVYPKSWQMYQHISGSWSELATREFDPIAVNTNFMDNLCGIRVWDGE